MICTDGDIYRQFLNTLLKSWQYVSKRLLLTHMWVCMHINKVLMYKNKFFIFKWFKIIWDNPYHFQAHFNVLELFIVTKTIVKVYITHTYATIHLRLNTFTFHQTTLCLSALKRSLYEKCTIDGWINKRKQPLQLFTFQFSEFSNLEW